MILAKLQRCATVQPSPPPLAIKLQTSSSTLWPLPRIEHDQSYTREQFPEQEGRQGWDR